MENLIRFVNKKINDLNISDYTFKSLFNIIHDQGDLIFSERIVNFSISSTSYKSIKEKIIKVSSVIDNFIRSEKGNFIGLLMDNSDEFIILFWALLAKGYKPLLLNKRFISNLLNECLDLTSCKVVISDTSIDLNSQVINYLDIINCDDQILYDINANDWANEIALSTSATSLNIKICIYDGTSICNQIINSKYIIRKNRMIKSRYEGKIKLLAFLPFYHIFGLIACYFWFSFFGRTFVFLNDYKPNTILESVRFHKVTHVFAVPMLWNEIAKNILVNAKKQDKTELLNKSLDKSIKLQSIFPFLGKKIILKKFGEVNNQIFGNSIRFCITGGSYINQETLKIINGIGYPLFQGYGMTELGITSVVLDKKARNRINNSIGKPFENVYYKINDNELVVKSECMCNRILSKDGIININKDEYYKTNDLANINNGYYYINGRKDDLCVNEDGENISPDIYEREISIDHAINYSLISLDGKKLSLIIQVGRNTNSIIKNIICNDIDKAINDLSSLGIYLSDCFITSDPLKNPNAIKISRTILKKQINDNSIKLTPLKEFKDTNNNYDNNEVCEIVKNIFACVLNKDVKDIKNDDHFVIDLSGNSLEYLTLISDLEKEFIISFDNKEYQLYSVNDFTNYILKYYER